MKQNLVRGHKDDFIDNYPFLCCFIWTRSRSTRYLQISRWQFGADSSIIIEFIARRVKARGDGRLFCSQPLIRLKWIVPKIAKLKKMSL